MTAPQVEPSPAGVPGAVTDPQQLLAEELTFAGAGGGHLVRPSPAIGEQLRRGAAASGQPAQVDVYEDAGHAFFADRPTYRPAPAAQRWQRLVPFLAEHLDGAR